jgi:hypothetical protein
MSTHPPFIPPLLVTMKALRLLIRGLGLELHHRVSGLQPLSPHYREQLSGLLRTRADQLWTDVLKLFAGLDARSALQQAWAFAPSASVWTGLLFSAATRQDEATRIEAHRLLRHSPDLLQRGRRARYHGRSTLDGLGRWLLMGEPVDALPMPDLGPLTAVPAARRLRFHLAAQLEQGASLATIFSRAAGQPAAPDRCRRVEFLRVLKVVQANRSPRPLLSLSLVVGFNDRELRLLRSLIDHWPLFVTPALARASRPLERLQALIDLRNQIDPTLDQVDQALHQRKFVEVDRLLTTLPAGRLVDTIARKRFQGRSFSEGDDWRHPALKPDGPPWIPLSRESHHPISCWRARPLPMVWRLSCAEVKQAILNGGVYAHRSRQGLAAQDLFVIRRGWSPEDQLELILSGAGALLDPASPAWGRIELQHVPGILAAGGEVPPSRLGAQLSALADARPWLRVMAQGHPRPLRVLAEASLSLRQSGVSDRHAWETFCATAVGTPEWQAVREPASWNTMLLRQAIAMRAARRPAVDPDAQRRAVVQALHEPDQTGRYVLARCREWLALDPDAIPIWVRDAPPALVDRMLRSRGTAADLRARIRALRPPSTRTSGALSPAQAGRSLTPTNTVN